MANTFAAFGTRITTAQRTANAPRIGEFVIDTDNNTAYIGVAGATDSDPNVWEAIGGIDVVANPSGTDGEDLTRITIGDTNYNLAAGSTLNDWIGFLPVTAARIETTGAWEVIFDASVTTAPTDATRYALVTDEVVVEMFDFSSGSTGSPVVHTVTALDAGVRVLDGEKPAPTGATIDLTNALFLPLERYDALWRDQDKVDRYTEDHQAGFRTTAITDSGADVTSRFEHSNTIYLSNAARFTAGESITDQATAGGNEWRVEVSYTISDGAFRALVLEPVGSAPAVPAANASIYHVNGSSVPIDEVDGVGISFDSTNHRLTIIPSGMTTAQQEAVRSRINAEGVLSEAQNAVINNTYPDAATGTTIQRILQVTDTADTDAYSWVSPVFTNTDGTPAFGEGFSLDAASSIRDLLGIQAAHIIHADSVDYGSGRILGGDFSHPAYTDSTTMVITFVDEREVEIAENSLLVPHHAALASEEDASDPSVITAVSRNGLVLTLTLDPAITVAASDDIGSDLYHYSVTEGEVLRIEGGTFDAGTGTWTAPTGGMGGTPTNLPDFPGIADDTTGRFVINAVDSGGTETLTWVEDDESVFEDIYPVMFPPSTVTEVAARMAGSNEITLAVGQTAPASNSGTFVVVTDEFSFRFSTFTTGTRVIGGMTHPSINVQPGDSHVVSGARPDTSGGSVNLTNGALMTETQYEKISGPIADDPHIELHQFTPGTTSTHTFGGPVQATGRTNFVTGDTHFSFGFADDVFEVGDTFTLDTSTLTTRRIARIIGQSGNVQEVIVQPPLSATDILASVVSNQVTRFDTASLTAYDQVTAGANITLTVTDGRMTIASTATGGGGGGLTWVETTADLPTSPTDGQIIRTRGTAITLPGMVEVEQQLFYGPGANGPSTGDPVLFADFGSSGTSTTGTGLVYSDPPFDVGGEDIYNTQINAGQSATDGTGARYAVSDMSDGSSPFSINDSGHVILSRATATDDWVEYGTTGDSTPNGHEGRIRIVAVSTAVADAVLPGYQMGIRRMVPAGTLAADTTFAWHAGDTTWIAIS